MAAIDLKDTYHLVSINSEDRKFLRFSFQGQLYEFSCLPFGLSSGPFTFTKLLKTVFSVMRPHGIICVAYIDDILIIASSFDQCINSIKYAINLL